MKTLKPLLKVLVIALLIGCVVAGYYLLKSMQASLDTLQTSTRLSELQSKNDHKDISAIKAKQDDLDKQMNDIKTNLQSTGDELKSKNEILGQLQKNQEENVSQIQELRTATDKLDAAMKGWQVDYVKALTGLEEKINLARKEMLDKIEAMASSGKPAPPKK